MEQERFFLALDCGVISDEEVRTYETAPAYRRAKAVWQLMYDQVTGKGGYLSTRTTMVHGRCYCIAFGHDVPRAIQMQVFHLMDRYRQQHPGLSFAQFPEHTIALSFRDREQVRKGRSPVALSVSETDAGALYEHHEARVIEQEAEAPVPIDPPFESISLLQAVWYLCLDFGKHDTESDRCYQETRAQLSRERLGIGAQQWLLEGHRYLLIIGEEVRQSVKDTVTLRFLGYHSRYGADFVRLPEPLLLRLWIQQEPLVAKTAHGTSFAETSAPDFLEMDEAMLAIEPISPPSPPASPDFKAKKTRPFLERYYTVRRLYSERKAGEMERSGATREEKRATIAVEQALILAASTAKKYRFANSALAMITTLMEQETGTTIRTLPEMGIFLEFAAPLDLGVYSPIGGLFFVSPVTAFRQFTDNLRSVFALAQAYQEAAQGIWILNVLEEDGDILLSLIYDSERRAWKLPEIRTCPDNACKQIMTVEEQVKNGAFTIWQMCPKCEKIARYFARWLPIALLAIEGEFAEEAEPVEREVTETITRKEKRKDSGKYDERKEEVWFKIVTFDASVKRKERERETGAERSEVSGTSWLDLAIAQNTVVYVRRHFGKSTRNLDPARNSRWKYAREVKVRDYDKRVPMTVAHLQKVITKVVASKYEQPVEV